MNTTPRTNGPGQRLLAEYLGVDDPMAALADRHPPGDRLHRLARALRQTAAELDGHYAASLQLQERLERLRCGPTNPGRLAESDKDVWQLALMVELAVERCDLTDTALVRLLAAYRELTPTA
ncbi:hypothetical protein ACFQVC_21515 [Streptomyces monticola]|uniref:NTP pyrophosphohydrolase MazG putative catalytic core domain-containing protein n=1 Tax=Streptomyces monticola TaxID=2666263 RepID=A0ABW2JM88_9ACTN